MQPDAGANGRIQRSGAPELGPNGLPYRRCPPAHNEWCKCSPFLAQLPADTVRSMHPAIVCRARGDVGGGMGLFCCNGLAKGEVVWAERKAAGPEVTAIPRTRAWIEDLPPASKKAYCHFMYKTGEDEYQSLAEFNDMPIAEYPDVRTIDVSNYMNHSCAPTCWFVDGGDEYTGLMVAARELSPGDEITYDYCTSEDCELSPDWECQCGSAQCRGRITPYDWQQPQLQARYAAHFLPHIAEKIARAIPVVEHVPTGSSPADSPAAARAEGATAPTAPIAPLAEADATASWWVAQLEGEHVMPAVASAAGRPDRLELIQHAASGVSLDLLHRQAAMLIVRHGLRVSHNDEVGGFVQAGVPIAAGELVMLLPPNLLLWEQEVDDFNKCLQLGTTSAGDRLFSSSLTPHDIDNYLCHSCEPNCRFVIGRDLTAGLFATRAIAEGDAITFDYDETEDDLRGERGGFDCHCGTASCRGQILGRLYSPKPPGVFSGSGASASVGGVGGGIGS